MKNYTNRFILILFIFIISVSVKAQSLVNTGKLAYKTALQDVVPLTPPLNINCVVNGVSITATGSLYIEYFPQVNTTSNCTPIANYSGVGAASSPWLDEGFITYNFGTPLTSATITYGIFDKIHDFGTITTNGCGNLQLSNPCGLTINGNIITGSISGTSFASGNVRLTVSSDKPFTSITFTDGNSSNTAITQGNLCNFTVVPYVCNVVAPLLSSTNININCPSTSTNLNTITASNTPNISCITPTLLTWHSSTPATLSNTLPSTNVGAGTYYASFLDLVTNCYSPTVSVVVNSTNSITPTFNQIPPTCAGSLLPLPTTSVNGITGTWLPALNNTVTTTYTFTPTMGLCALSTTMTVVIIKKKRPLFNEFEPGEPIIICSGTTPFPLLNTSYNGITGTWSPSIINNTTSSNYIFTPNPGQCALSISIAVMVVSVNHFVANSDIFFVTQPISTSINTDTVLTNDTYLGNYLSTINNFPVNFGYNIVPIATTPNSFANGGITFNSTNGTFSILPNTTPGSYTYYYALQTPCGITTPTTAVTINISNYVTSLYRAQFSFCFNNSSATQSTTNLLAPIYNDLTSLFKNVTIGGAPATSSNSFIQLQSPTTTASLASLGITINADGTFTIAQGTLPGNWQFYYKVCALNGVNCSDNILWSVHIISPLKIVADTATFTTNGVGNYNVLTNDRRNLCDTTTGITLATINLNTINLSANNSLDNFSINGSGQIISNTLLGPIPVGNYILNYTVCDNTFPVICATQTVQITVNSNNPFAPENSTNLVLKKPTIKKATKNSYQIIEFPDTNLKAKLLEASPFNNIAASIIDGYSTAIDLNNDEEIDTNEALQITLLRLDESNISNLEGLQYFENLITLQIAFNNLTNCNLSMPNLATLALNNNPLTTITIANTPNLQILSLSNTLVTTLNTNDNALLTRVNAPNTLLSHINLENSPNLNYLDFKNSANLTTVNIKNTSSLDYEQYAQVCWTNCPNLTSICADDSEIPALQNYLSNCGINQPLVVSSTCALNLETQLLENNFSIAPNPSKGLFEILNQNQNNQIYYLEVYTVLGQKIITKNNNNNQKTLIDLSQYSSGSYIVKIYSDDTVVNKIILKE